MTKFDKSIFLKPKDKRLAKEISIESPAKFRKSIRKLKIKGLTTKERRALNLARTRAKLQLKRQNLSAKERRQFTDISRTRI